MLHREIAHERYEAALGRLPAEGVAAFRDAPPHLSGHAVERLWARPEVQAGEVCVAAPPLAVAGAVRTVTVRAGLVFTSVDPDGQAAAEYGATARAYARARWGGRLVAAARVLRVADWRAGAHAVTHVALGNPARDLAEPAAAPAAAEFAAAVAAGQLSGYLACPLCGGVVGNRADAEDCLACGAFVGCDGRAAHPPPACVRAGFERLGLRFTLPADEVRRRHVAGLALYRAERVARAMNDKRLELLALVGGPGYADDPPEVVARIAALVPAVAVATAPAEPAGPAVRGLDFCPEEDA